MRRLLRPHTLPRALLLILLGTLALPATAVVPTYDAAAIAKLIETVSSALKQIQQLRALSDGLVSLKDAIGDIDSVESFKRTLRDAADSASTTHPAWLDLQSPPSTNTGPAHEQGAPAPDVARRALLARSGPYLDWNPDQAIDRPSFASQSEALRFALAELYTDPDRVSEAGAAARLEIERVQSLRARILQSTALYAYTIASATSAEWENQEQARNTLAEHLGDAESLREDIAVLTHTALHSLSIRNKTLLVESTTLELQSLNAIMQGPLTLAPAVRTALEARTTP